MWNVQDFPVTRYSIILLFLGVPKPCTQLYPAHFNLHPGHFSLHLALYNTLNVIRPKILHVIRHFWSNLGRKSCLFYSKIGTSGISRMLILVPTLVFWISNPKSIFGQIWAKKVKVVRFAWKLTHMVSWKCRFRIRT